MTWYGWKRAGMGGRKEGVCYIYNIIKGRSHISRGSQQKFTFQGSYEMNDPEINRPTKRIGQMIEIYKVFKLNFRPDFKPH